VQIPSWDGRLFDLKRAAESKTYCDEVLGTLATHGLQLTELSTHLQGQLVAVHPAYDAMFDGFAAEAVRGNRKARQEWAVEQLQFAARASADLGLKARHFPGRWPGPTFTHGRSAPPGSSRPPSKNWPRAGYPF
jgi:sugar phosphate isomerase/epimerase